MKVARKMRKGAEILRYGLVRAAASILGFRPRHRAPDRVIFDDEILPALARHARGQRVLFVGCDWYTTHVEDLFRDAATYTTLEIDPGRAKHGAKRHIVAPLSDLSRHVETGALDLILMNGVIGWGLNDAADIASSLQACRTALSASGTLLIGWDDVPEKAPVDVETVTRQCGFEAVVPPGIASPRIETQTYARHIFSFWRPARR